MPALSLLTLGLVRLFSCGAGRALERSCSVPDYFWVPVERVKNSFLDGTFVTWKCFLGEDTQPRIGGVWFDGEPDYVLFGRNGAPVSIPQPDESTVPHLHTDEVNL